jgi:elongation factor Tu
MPTDPFLRLTVEDVFHISGRGTVLTGKIESGTLQVGDEVLLRGTAGERRAQVSGIEMFRKVLQRAEAGQNVGVLLRGVEKADVSRGDVITATEAIPSLNFSR